VVAIASPDCINPSLIGGELFVATWIAGLELLTAFPYFASIAMTVGSGVTDAGKLSLLAIYRIVYTLPPILIAAVFAVIGERAERVLRPIGA
jgi:hypothetical protein